MRKTIGQAIGEFTGNAETRTKGTTDQPAIKAESTRKRTRRTSPDAVKD